MINSENIKCGDYLVSSNKEFLVLKVNVKSFYIKELGECDNPISIMEDFKSRPRSFVLKDYCIKNKIDELKLPNESFILSEKKALILDEEIKKKAGGISPCCAKLAAKVYSQTKYSGRIFCRKCGKPLNIIKLEADNWLSFSQNRSFYQINLENMDIRKYEKNASEAIDKNKVK